MAGDIKKVRVAVIGCGTIGKVHASNYMLCPDVELAAVVDIVPARAEKLAQEHGVALVLSDYRELFARGDIQAVSVCLPNYLHAPVSIECLQAGLHVLCEKPVALNAKEGAAMQAAARAAGRNLIIGVVNRFNDNVNFIRDMIGRGELGTVYQVQAMFRNHRCIPGLGGWFTDKKRSGGGVMIDWGVHFIDLILYCLDFPELRSISGAAHARLAVNPRDYVYLDMWAGPPDYAGVCDVEEYASGFVRTAGPAISFEGAWAQNIGVEAMYIDFMGDKAGVRLQYGGDFTVWGVRGGGLEKCEIRQRQSSMFCNELADFARCVRSGERSRSDIDSVLPTQRLLDAFYLSAAEGREVPVAAR